MPFKIRTFHGLQATFCLTVVGTEATMSITRLNPVGYVLTVMQSDTAIETIKQERFNGVDQEIAQFIRSVKAFKEVPDHCMLLFHCKIIRAART